MHLLIFSCRNQCLQLSICRLNHSSSGLAGEANHYALVIFLLGLMKTLKRKYSLLSRCVHSVHAFITIIIEGMKHTFPSLRGPMSFGMDLLSSVRRVINVTRSYI